VIFQFKNKVFAAAVTKDARMHILDTKSLGGADHQTPVTKSNESGKSSEPVALAVWQGSKLVHWLLAATDAASRAT
jgi:hypothetical protein